MTLIVVDGSVVPKWYVPEVQDEFARRLLSPPFEMTAPSILASEFVNVALQKFRRGLLSRSKADEMAAELPRLPVVLLDSIEFLPAAYVLAQAFHPSVYDCLYAALALSLGCQLVTADRPLYQALLRPFPETMLWIEDIPEPPPSQT